jgi:hypothetical protein
MSDCVCTVNPCANPKHQPARSCDESMPFIMQRKLDAGWEKTESGYVCPKCWIRNNPQIKSAIDTAQTIASDVRKQLGLD